MAVIDQVITKDYAIYNGDCVEVMRSLPDESVDMSIYSPPFVGLYTYSSDPRDISNCRTTAEFFEHYAFCVEQVLRMTKPGRISAVHCAEIMKNGSNLGGMFDLPGEIIRLHEKIGFEFWTRRALWKEPLEVRNRTLSKGLSHYQTVHDCTLTTIANADYILQFRKKGENAVPVVHDTGFHTYAGERPIPRELWGLRGYTGKQTENRFSHWIWRQYASSVWDDIRWGRILLYKESKEPEDERHVHPLQLDVIERCCALWTNPGEVVLTPFLGVGSEAFGAVINGRKAIGIELKGSYYRQAIRNLSKASKYRSEEEDQSLPFEKSEQVESEETDEEE